MTSGGHNKTHNQCNRKSANHSVWKSFVTMHYKYPAEVCVRWSGDASNFLEDMGPRPKGLVLRRRNIIRPFSPHNCYWGKRTNQCHYH